MTNKSLDEEIEGLDLTEKTEMEGLAEQVFRTGDERTNIHPAELGLIMACDVHFNSLGIPESNPTNNFKKLAKSRMGWSTNKLIEGLGGVNNMRSGGQFGQFMKERLFTPKQ